MASPFVLEHEPLLTPVLDAVVRAVFADSLTSLSLSFFAEMAARLPSPPNGVRCLHSHVGMGLRSLGLVRGKQQKVCLTEWGGSTSSQNLLGWLVGLHLLVFPERGFGVRVWKRNESWEGKQVRFSPEAWLATFLSLLELCLFSHINLACRHSTSGIY